MTTFQEQLRTAYLDYLNNYLNIERFAAVNNITEDDAHTMIIMGMKYHKSYVGILNSNEVEVGGNE